MPEVGDKAPDFTLLSTDGLLQLSRFARGRKVVLAFYTEDNTPICSQELSTFRKEYATIQELGAEVIAISVDTVTSHKQFCDAVGGYPFPLVSDTEQRAAKLYQVLDDEDKRTRRAIFVIDESGTIVHQIPWYQPSNPGQLMEVFQALGLEA